MSDEIMLILTLIWEVTKLFFEIGATYFLLRALLYSLFNKKWEPNRFELFWGFFGLLFVFIQNLCFFRMNASTINGKDYKEIGWKGYWKELTSNGDKDLESEGLYGYFKKRKIK